MSVHRPRRRRMILSWWRREAQERFLAAGELLGSFLLLARAPDAAGHAGGLRALALGRRLGAEVAEVLRELRCPWLAESEAESGTAPESPLHRG